MIDFHTHILPAVDDGARHLETSVAMLNEELSQGVERVLLTPHYYGRKESPARFLARRNQAFERLKEHIPEGIAVQLGVEVHFTGINLPEYEELCKLAIEGTKYLLVEFPFTTAWTGDMFDKLADFIDETGYTPVIAHIERYGKVQKRPELVNQLIDMGCLIQVNANSFYRKRESKLSLALLKHGLVHCIGTDAHDMEGRAPDLFKAKETAIKAGCKKEWEKAERIMKKVVEGEQVRVGSGKPVKKILWKYV